MTPWRDLPVTVASAFGPPRATTLGELIDVLILREREEAPAQVEPSGPGHTLRDLLDCDGGLSYVDEERLWAALPTWG